MSKEDFVTYEQAVALKELGFNKKCLYYYNANAQMVANERDYQEEVSVKNLYTSYNNEYTTYNRVDAPTLAQAHNFVITKGTLVVPYSMSFESWQCRVCKKGESFCESKLYEDFNSYEEALSAGITECIKILENGKTD